MPTINSIKPITFNLSLSQQCRLKRNCNCADTVSFGCKNLELNKTESNKAVYELMRVAGKRYFSPNDIMDIMGALNKKNCQYLPRILNLNANFGKQNIIEILSYIRRPNVQTKNIDEKFTVLEGLQDRLSKMGEKRNSSVKSYLESVMLPVTSENLIKTDILLKGDKEKLRSIDESLEMVYDTLEHRYDKWFNSPKNQLNIQQQFYNIRMAMFVDTRFEPLLIAARTTNNDVINELVYNRHAYFDTVYANRLRILVPEDYKILKEVTSNSKKLCVKNGILSYEPLTVDEKVDMINLLALNRSLIKSGRVSVDMKHFKPQHISKPFSVIDVEKLKEEFITPVLMYCGMSRIDAERYKTNYMNAKKDNFVTTKKDNFWDINLLPLFISNSSPFLKNVVKASTLGDFEDYLYDKNTEVGQKNIQNKKLFEKSGISAEKWLKPDIQAEKTELISRKGDKKISLTAKMWNRNPKKSIFDGNYTTCCTGIDKERGSSFPKYLANTIFNVVEVKDKDDKTVGMSRLFLAKVAGQPSIVIDNIEVNNKIIKHYLHNDENKQKYREMVFDYVRNLANDMNKNKQKPIPVYFSNTFFKVPDINKGLEDNKIYQIKLLGNPPESVYINAYKDVYDFSMNYDSSNPLEADLIDVTEKTNPED